MTENDPHDVLVNACNEAESHIGVALRAYDAVCRERDAWSRKAGTLMEAESLRVARIKVLEDALVNAAVPLETLAYGRAIGVGESLQSEVEHAVLGIRAALEAKP